MAEFIGARISLVSKSDIRYVGTLHEINSETSTVALENVKSFGTEGRKGGDDEIAPNDAVYEYIVFRGSDVKDLRIEEAPTAKENKAPQVPNDPAIMSSSGSRPTPQAQQQGPQGGQQPQGGPPQRPGSQGPIPPGGPPPFGHHPQYPPPFGYPPPAGWGGRGGPPGPPFPPMPYGAPPQWGYPPPGQHGFPPGPFPPYGYPPGPPGQDPRQQQQHQQGQVQKPAPIGPGANKPQSTSPPAADKEAEPKSLARPAAEMAAAAVQKAPAPPAASKASPSEPKAPVAQPSISQSAATAAVSKAPSGPKTNRIQPVIPLQSPALTKTTLPSSSTNVASPPAAGVNASLRDATQAATAAVAAAMAKLPQQQSNGSAMDNLTKKVNEMRTNDPIRAPRQPSTSGNFTQGRGRGRGGPRNAPQKVEVPATDFDFESSNAKFHKEDLVKEAAASPLGETPPAINEPDAPVAGYNKKKSFFDDISSESKDRTDGGSGRPGGREWRGEEQKKNVETFGQGSVDNGYRGGFRGRGRGRGFRGGRGGYGGNGQPRGRGGYRGGDAQVTTQ